MMFTHTFQKHTITHPPPPALQQVESMVLQWDENLAHTHHCLHNRKKCTNKSYMNNYKPLLEFYKLVTSEP